MRSAALLLLLLSAPWGAAVEPRATTGDAFLRRAEAVMLEDTAFFGLHRGFLDYLDARPALLAAELAWWDVLIEPRMGAAAAGFEEALLADPTATAALDAYYDLLARDPAVRESVDSLQRIELSERTQRNLVAPAMEALRADPDLALRLLQGGLDTDLLGAPLQAFGRLLQSRPALAQELGAAFGAIEQAPLTQTRLRPWWQQLVQRGGVPTAYAALSARFAEAPRRYWAWHQRELGWAADAQARSWARHLYAQARRVPGVGDAYPHYLRALYARDDARGVAESRYDAQGIVATAFPPLPAPPTLAPKIRDAQADAPERLTPRMPERPDLPKSPARPTEPTRPTLEMRKAKPRAATPDQNTSGRGRRSEESGE